MRPQKASVGNQLFCQLIQTADTFQYFPAGQVDEQRPVDHLAVFQLCRLDPCDTGFAVKDQTACLLFLALGENRVHQTGEALHTDGLELVIKSIHRV